MGSAESKNAYGNSSNKNLPRREEKAVEKAESKRSGNDPADCPVSEQQANSSKRSATEAVMTELKTGSSSNAGVVRGPDGRRSNLQGGCRTPKRGNVKKMIIKEAVGVVASAYGCCCSSSTSTLDVDKFLNDVPFPTKREAMATLWPDISE